MSPDQIARLLRARRYAKGRWMCRCMAHPDKTGSLSISDMGGGKTRLHCFGGCSQKQVLDAMGLTWRDLRPGDVTPEIKERLTWEAKKEALERQLGIVIMLGSVEPGKRNYWAAAERNIRRQLGWLRCRMEPEKVIEEWRMQRIRERAKQYGWERLWEEEYGKLEDRSSAKTMESAKSK